MKQSLRCCQSENNFVSLRRLRTKCPETYIFGESVFALSFKRNLPVSMRERVKTTTPSPVFGFVYSTQSIRVWGLFPFIFSRVLSEPLLR